jgi:hypothetical protein
MTTINIESNNVKTALLQHHTTAQEKHFTWQFKHPSRNEKYLSEITCLLSTAIAPILSRRINTAPCRLTSLYKHQCPLFVFYSVNL